MKVLNGACPASLACKGEVPACSRQERAQHNQYRMELPFREAAPVRAGSFTLQLASKHWPAKTANVRP